MFYKKLAWDIATGEVLEVVHLLYDGPVELCKGATDQQKELEAQQAQFYATLTKDYKTQFAHQSAILANLDASWSPVLAGGINQYGFSKAEDTALRSAATENTAAEYQKAAKATNEAIAAEGGGNEFLPSGAADEMKQQVATAAAAQEASQNLGITEAGYNQGRADYIAASNALGGFANQYNPTGYASSANTAGSDAANTASQIQQADAAASPWGAIGGLVGGAADSFLSGGFASLQKPPAPCWIAAAVFEHGWDDPRTSLVREWLTEEFTKSFIGRLVVSVYIAVGEEVAWFVKRSSVLKALFRPLFDKALRKAVEWKAEKW